MPVHGEMPSAPHPCPLPTTYHQDLDIVFGADPTGGTRTLLKYAPQPYVMEVGLSIDLMALQYTEVWGGVVCGQVPGVGRLGRD